MISITAHGRVCLTSFYSYILFISFARALQKLSILCSITIIVTKSTQTHYKPIIVPYIVWWIKKMKWNWNWRKFKSRWWRQIFSFVSKSWKDFAKKIGSNIMRMSYGQVARNPAIDLPLLNSFFKDIHMRINNFDYSSAFTDRICKRDGKFQNI